MEDYKTFKLIQNGEYMFATECTFDNHQGVLRLDCPDVGGGHLGFHKGCRSKSLADPDFEPKAIIVYAGTIGSYGRVLFWVHRFDIDQSGFYVRDTSGSCSLPRETNRRNKKTGLYRTTFHLIKVEIKGLDGSRFGGTPHQYLGSGILSET